MGISKVILVDAFFLLKKADRESPLCYTTSVLRKNHKHQVLDTVLSYDLSAVAIKIMPKKIYRVLHILTWRKVVILITLGESI